MKQALGPVVAELAAWRDQGLALPVWWRDDDATVPTPALDRLLALASDFAAPLHIAVIPEPATTALADRLREQARVFALPHGWTHLNRAPAGEKKAEFGAHRPVAVMLDEIAGGWRRVETMFGAQALPVFTPPWNRVAPSVVEGLRPIGLQAVTTFKPRSSRLAAEGLCQVNTHLDPIAWHGGSGLIDPAVIAAQLTIELSDRRHGRADNAEPYGLLTHHLVHDEPIWSFVSALLEILAESGVARWTPPLHAIGKL